jgi:pyrroline-5-carboxylate reductase
MGGALARGLIKAGVLADGAITLYDVRTEATEALAAELSPNATVASSAIEAVRDASVVLIAVKPNTVVSVITQVKDALTKDHLIISIAAGITLEKMQTAAGPGIPVIRVMPNTPSLVGEGAAAICAGESATYDHIELATTFFAAIGKAVVVEERLLDAVTGLSGSGPAYVYLMIEAMADGGVKAGLPRETARLLAAQTVFGAAKMVLTSNDHPAQLKDRVTTPGGTTIAALAVLENKGFRSALIEAVDAAAKRAKELS